MKVLMWALFVLNECTPGQSFNTQKSLKQHRNNNTHTINEFGEVLANLVHFFDFRNVSASFPNQYPSLIIASTFWWRVSIEWQLDTNPSVIRLYAYCSTFISKH